jgi:hypothetical protein
MIVLAGEEVKSLVVRSDPEPAGASLSLVTSGEDEAAVRRRGVDGVESAQEDDLRREWKFEIA